MRFDKIFEVSFPRTGSRSAAYAACMLGIRTCHNTLYHYQMMDDWLYRCYRGEYAESMIIKTYDWIGQLPAAIWQNLFCEFPDAGFVLCVRPIEAWATRAERHHLKPNTYLLNKDMRNAPLSLRGFNRLGQIGMTNWNRKHWINRYQFHNEHVQHVIPKDQLLVMNVFEGDGWQKICQFLDKDVPDLPFPWVKRGGNSKLKEQEGEMQLRENDKKWLAENGVPNACGPRAVQAWKLGCKQKEVRGILKAQKQALL